jgi:acetyl esterase
MATPLHPALQDLCATTKPVNLAEVDPAVARINFINDKKASEVPAPQMPVRDFEIAGPDGPIAVRLYRPVGLPNGANPILLYFHGGGFFFGNLDTHDSICRVLAQNAACLVLSVDYRLSPESRFPAATEDAYAALQWIAAHAAEIGADPARIATGGDSAGANLAAAICLATRERAGPPIAFQLLIYPWLDMVNSAESRKLFAKGYMLEAMDFFTETYLGPGADPHHPLASPLRAKNLAGLPPAYILTAGYDPLRDEGSAYAKRLTEAGVKATHVCAEDMIHGFVGRRKLLAEADVHLKECAAALAQAFRR